MNIISSKAIVPFNYYKPKVKGNKMYCGESINYLSRNARLKAVKLSCLATLAVTLVLILTFYLMRVKRCVSCDGGIGDLWSLIGRA